MMASAGQLAFTFDPFSPFEPRQLPQWGFWTLNQIPSGGGRMLQEAWSLRDMEWVLRQVAKDRTPHERNTFMSQGFFERPCRRAIHLLACTHLQVDLDTYNMPALRDLTPDQLCGCIRIFCRDNGILPPSSIIHSGRGLYLKWYLSKPIPRAAAGRAVAVNRALVGLFAEFGADPAAVDMSRILRVIGTRNTKTGQVVRLLHQETSNGQPVSYPFDAFSGEVLNRRRHDLRNAAHRSAETRSLRDDAARRRCAQRCGNQRAFSREDWHWGILEDIRTLINRRFGGRVRYSDEQTPSVTGGKRPGADLFAHLGACQLAMVMPGHVLWHEVQAWARLILPPDYVSSAEFARHTSTLLERARRAAARERVEYDGRKLSPIWTYSKDRMIELLQIERDEMPLMIRLIDDEEKRRRDRNAWRRSHTGQSRDEYLARAAAGRESVRSLRAQGLSWRAVGRELGISESEARRLGTNAQGPPYIYWAKPL